MSKAAALAAVSLDGMALRDIPIFGFRDDKDVVLAAVTQNGMALQFAPAFASDLEVVAKAVAQNHEALQFASAESQCHEDVAFLAVCGDSSREERRRSYAVGVWLGFGGLNKPSAFGW